MSFAETRLDLGIDYGTVGGPRFSTSIIVDGAGAEQRNANWNQPLGKWQIGDRVLDSSELNYFLDFHAARRGAAEGFRFKDWADYQGLSQRIGTGDGTDKQFQLAKTYTVGAYTAIRSILKPVGGTIRIYLNGVLATGWSVDLSSGIITFVAAPGVGVAVTADFEFDCSVRFEQDKIDFRFDAIEAGGEAFFYLAALTLVEVRIAPTLPIAKASVPSGDFLSSSIFDLGYDYGTLGGPAYNTTIATVGAGYERRTSNWDGSKSRWQIGSSTLSRSELDYFLAFFRVARGAANSFLYKDWATGANIRARFETDSIEFRFDAFEPSSGEAIFYLAGVPIVETKAGASATYNALTAPVSDFGISSCYIASYNCVGGACVMVPNASGRYKTLQECEAALIRPSFSGGQCQTLYTVTLTTQSSCSDPDASSDRTVVITNVPGPIQGITEITRGLVAGAGYFAGYQTIYTLRARGNYASDYGGSVLCEVGLESSSRIVSIVRQDGLPDDCGDAPASCPS